MSLYQQHLPTLERARQACRERHCWSPYPEMPAKYPNAELAQGKGLQMFEQHLGSAQGRRRFALDQPGQIGWLGEEVSPYTQAPLHIDYPQADIDTLFEAAGQAMPSWARASIEDRLGVLMQVLDAIYRDHLFEMTHAVMHTAG